MSGAPSELTPSGTQRPPPGAAVSKQQEEEEGEEFQVLDCALNQVPAVTEQRHCLVFIFIAKNCPEELDEMEGHGAGPQPSSKRLLASPAGIQTRVARVHLQGQGTNWCLHLPLASPAPKILTNANKGPQGLGNQTCPALGSSLKSQDYKNSCKMLLFHRVKWLNALCPLLQCRGVSTSGLEERAGRSRVVL